MNGLEHRYKCIKCGYSCLQSEIINFKRMTFTARFPICPKCGEYKIRVANPDGTLFHNKAVMYGYAVKREGK